MEKILNEMGLNQFVPSFRQVGYNLNTFKYIMSKGNEMSKKIIANDTGLNVHQVDQICVKIEQLYGTDFVNLAPGQLTNLESLQNGSQNQNHNVFPQSKSLTSSYGRSNRIKKLFQIPANKPKKELSQIQRMNLARKTSQQKNQVLENFFKRPSETQSEACNKQVEQEDATNQDQSRMNNQQAMEKQGGQFEVKIDESTMNLGNKLADDLLKNEQLSSNCEANQQQQEDNTKVEHDVQENDIVDVIEIEEAEPLTIDNRHQLLNNKASQDYVMDKLNDLKNHPQSQHYSQNNGEINEDSSSCMDDEQDGGLNYQIKEPAQPNYISSSQYSEQNKYLIANENNEANEQDDEFEQESEKFCGQITKIAEQNEEIVKQSSQQFENDSIDSDQMMMQKANQFLQSNLTHNDHTNSNLNNDNNDNKQYNDECSSEHQQQNSNDPVYENVDQGVNMQADEEDSASSITSSQQDMSESWKQDPSQHDSRPTIGLKQPASSSFRQLSQQQHDTQILDQKEITKENENQDVNNQLEELQRQLQELQKQQLQYSATNNQQPSFTNPELPNITGQGQNELKKQEGNIELNNVLNMQQADIKKVDSEVASVDEQNCNEQKPNDNTLQFTQQEVTDAKYVENEHYNDINECQQSSYNSQESSQNNQLSNSNQYQPNQKQQFSQNREEALSNDISDGQESQSEDQSSNDQNINQDNQEMKSEYSQSSQNVEDLPSDSEFNNAAQRKKDCLKMQSMWASGKQQIEQQDEESDQEMLEKEEDDEQSYSESSSQHNIQDNNFHQSLLNQQYDPSYKSGEHLMNSSEKQQNVMNQNNEQLIQQQENLNIQNLGPIYRDSLSGNQNDKNDYENQQNRMIDQVSKSPQVLINKVQQIQQLYNFEQPKIYHSEQITQPNAINQIKQDQDFNQINQQQDRVITYQDKPEQTLTNEQHSYNSANKHDQVFSQQQYQYNDTNSNQPNNIEQIVENQRHSTNQEETHQLLMAQMLHDTTSENLNRDQSQQRSNSYNNHFDTKQTNMNHNSSEQLKDNENRDNQNEQKEQIDKTTFRQNILVSKEIQTAIEQPLNDTMRYDQYVQINAKDLLISKDNVTQAQTYSQLENQITQELQPKLTQQLQNQIREQLQHEIYDKAKTDLKNEIGQQIKLYEREQLTNCAKIEAKQELEMVLKTQYELQNKSEIEQLKVQLEQYHCKKLDEQKEQNRQQQEELNKKLELAESKHNQYIDMIKRKDKELEILKQNDVQNQNLVANLNTNLNQLQQQKQLLEQQNDQQQNKLMTEKQLFEDRTLDQDEQIQNQQIQLHDAQQQIKIQSEQIINLQNDLKQEKESAQLIQQRLRQEQQMKQKEKDRQLQQQKEIEQQIVEQRAVLEQEKIRKEKIEKERLIQIEQERRREQQRQEQIQNDIIEKQRQLNQLQELQKQKNIQESSYKHQLNHSNSSIQLKQPEIPNDTYRNISKSPTKSDKDRNQYDTNKLQTKEVEMKGELQTSKREENQQRYDDLQNKRIEKQKYKQQKTDYYKLKDEIALTQKQRMEEMIQKQQQLEMLKRELTEKGGVSSSSKNELQSQSQDYQKSESDDRQMRTIIQKSVEAYDSLEQKKLKYQRQNQNLQQMVMSSQISNQNHLATSKYDNQANLQEPQQKHQVGGNNYISVINLDDENDEQLSHINSQSPSKHSKNMSHVKEESSFLPDQIIPSSKVEKKKIIKRVRFHDDENNELIYPASSKNQSIKRQKVDDTNEDQEQNECFNINKEQFMEEQCDRDFQKSEQNRHKIEDIRVDNIRRQQQYEIGNRDSIYGNAYNNHNRNFNKKIYVEDRQHKHQQDTEWDPKALKKKSKSKQNHVRVSGSSRSQSPVIEMNGNHSYGKGIQHHYNGVEQSPVQHRKVVANNQLDDKMEEYVNNLDSATKKNANLLKMIKKISGNR